MNFGLGTQKKNLAKVISLKKYCYFHFLSVGNKICSITELSRVCNYLTYYAFWWLHDPYYSQLNKYDFTYFIYGEHHLNAGGPSSNAEWATSGYDILGVFLLLHNSYSALTSKCMQYVQINPIIKVPIAPVI